MKLLKMKTNNLKFKTSIILILCFSIFTNPLIAQDNNISEDLKPLFYRAYLTSSSNLWIDGINKLTERFENSSEDMEILLELAKAQYGLLQSCIPNKDKSTFNKYVDKLEKNVSKLLKHNEKSAIAHVLQAGIYSVKMAFAPMKGMYLGPKNIKHTELAIKYDDKLPEAIEMKASSKLFTPEAFGGDIPGAVKLYTKAVELYELNPEELAFNWNYINALAWLGVAHQKAENNAEALKVYNKVLEVEPEFNWVKFALKPSVQEK